MNKTKKLIIIFSVIIIIILGFFISQKSQNASADIASGLVGYWKFDETSGITAADSSGLGNNGMLVNGPTWTTGKVNNALSFDGADDYVDLPDGNTYLNPSAGTIAFWFKSGGNSSSDSHFLYYYNFGGCSSISVELFGWSPTTIRSRHFIGCQGTPDYIDTTVDNWSTAQSQWHFFTYTWDVANNKLATFYDGAYISQPDDLNTGALYAANSVIGSVAYGMEGTQALFKGLFDDYRVYNRALTQSDIQELYGVTPPPSTDTQAPSVPTNLSAASVSSSQINLSWSASSDNIGVTGYKVFRNSVQVATVATNSYSDTGLAPSTTYIYTVSAYDAAGNNSAQSSSVSATTQASSGGTTITKYLDNGPTSNHIDLAIIGSGFTQAELNTYIAKANKNIDNLWTVNWFLTNKSLFNVWRIDKASLQSGIDLSDAEINLEAANVQYDILVVLHNYDGQENVNKPYVEIFSTSDQYVVLAHELGHKIGQLGDEYAAGGTCNGLSKMFINVHDKPNNEKWSDLILTAPYEGALNCPTGLWRPSQNSIMLDSANAKTFDAVGLKAMDLGAGKIIGTTESTAPSLSISGVADNDTKSGTFTATANTSDASGIERVEFYWAKAGDTSKSIKIDRIAPYDISIDTTQYANGQYYLDILSYDAKWNYARKTTLFNISNGVTPPVIGTTITSIIAQEALTQDSAQCLATYNPNNAYCQRQNMPGIARTSEPLTVGIPLAENSGIASVNQLGIPGSAVQQFRPLAYWPNGNIKWVLVDTQASVAANGQTAIDLLRTSYNPAGIGLAVDQGSYISINTGPAQFKIKKANFNMIDSAVINGKQMLTEGNSGGISILGFDNVTYDTKNDSASFAVIEENGPAKAVVKAAGSFKSPAGARLMDYTIRFNFYKNKTYIQPTLILRNADRENDHPTKKVFSNIQINLPLNLGVTKQFGFATNKGIKSGTINNSAYIFQAFSRDHTRPEIENDSMDGSLAWYNAPMKRLTDAVDANFEQKGLEVKNGATVLNALGNEYEWAGGYAEIKDETNSGLTIALQYMSSRWPTSVEFKSDGTAEIGIYSKYNSKKDIGMGWGTHETRELILDFHASASDNNLDVYRLEQPFIGRAPFQHYLDARVLYGEQNLANAQEWDQFWLKNYGSIVYDHPVGVWSQQNTNVVVWRSFWYSGVVGFDAALGQLLTFLKNGNGGNYMASLQKTSFNTDSSVERSDGFDYSLSLIRTSYLYPVDDSNSFNRGGGMNEFDYLHNHFLAMPMLYYMTGKEDIKDAVQDYAEDYIRRSAAPKLWTSYTDSRANSRTYRSLALLYEFTKDSRLFASLERYTNDLLDSRDVAGTCNALGRNLERGYGLFDGCGGSNYFQEPTIHGFFYISIHPEDVWEGLRVIKQYDPAYPRIEEVEEYLLGLGQFLYNEPLLFNSAGTDYGYPYDYYINRTNQWITGYINNPFNNYMRKDDSSRIFMLVYQKTGETKYLDMAKKLLAFGGGYGSSNPIPAHQLAYIDSHGAPQSWKYVSGVNVQNNGSGRYTLSWTVPQGATAYQIKYSDKPIVDWLGFNQVTRTYQYNPSQYTAFFAANVIDNEPAPLSAGSIQSATIDINQTMSSYNSSRNLTSTNNSYLTYNSSKTYYFSVKYLSGSSAPPPPIDTTPPSAPTGVVAQ